MKNLRKKWLRNSIVFILLSGIWSSGLTAGATEEKYTVPLVNDGSPTNPYPIDETGLFNIAEKSVSIIPDFSTQTEDDVYAAIRSFEGRNLSVMVKSEWTSWGNLTVTADASSQENSHAYGIYNRHGSEIHIETDSNKFIVKGKEAVGVYAGNDSGDKKSLVTLSGIGNFDFDVKGGKTTGMEAGKNGEILRADPAQNYVRDVTVNSRKGYGLYAHDGGKIELHYVSVEAPRGDALHAERGGTIYAGSIGTVSGNITTDDASDSYIMASVKGKLEGNVRGNVDLVLLRQGIWNGKNEGVKSLVMNDGSLWNAADIETSTFGELKGDNGIIRMNKNGAGLNIRNLAGRIVFAFERDGTQADKVLGGNVVIDKADKNTSVTVFTDSTGLGTAEESVKRHVLEQLASRLFYTGYTQGEKNISGTVKIGEGLTAGGMTLAISELGFDLSTGQGKSEHAKMFTEASPITFSADDVKYKEAGIASEDYKIYTFDEDTYLNIRMGTEGTPIPSQMKYALAIAPKTEGDHMIDLQGNDFSVVGKVTVKNMNQITGTAIYQMPKGTLTIEDPGHIHLESWTDYYYGGCIAAGGRFNTYSEDERATVHIKNDNSWDHRVSMTGTVWGAYNGSSSNTSSIFWVNFTGIKTFDYGNVFIDGLVDINTTDAWCVSGIGEHSIISLGGGSLNARHYTAIDSYNKGTVNINIKNGQQKGIAYQPGNNKVNIRGNISSRGQWVGDKWPGYVNVALTTPDSTFNGRAESNSYKEQVGWITMWLQNGATWTNQDGGFRYGDNWAYYTKEDSVVENFIGGKSEETRGVIHQKYGAPEDSLDPEKEKGASNLYLKNYSGHTLVLMDHGKDESGNLIMTGGNIQIDHANKERNRWNASITMRTDNDGIDTADPNVVVDALQKLANKLIYTGYAKSGAEHEENLYGNVEIAEGLTASSAAAKLGTITFKPDGQGDYAPSPVITGDEAKDTYYILRGIRQADGTYQFMEDSTVAVDEKDITQKAFPVIDNYANIMATVFGTDKDIKIDAAGKTLKLHATYISDKPETEMSDNIDTIGIYTKKKVDIKAKELDIRAKSVAETGFETIGICLKDGAEVNIDGSVSIQSLREKSWQGGAYGIYMDSSTNKLTIHGDLTMRGDGTEGDALYGVWSEKKSPPTPNGEYEAKGIYTDYGDEQELTVKGRTDIAAKGTGLDINECKVLLEGGATIITPDDVSESYYAISSGFGGNVIIGRENLDMNTMDGVKTVIQGTVRTFTGRVQIGMGTSDSCFTGVVQKGIDEDEVIIGLLAKGATWENRQTSKMKGFTGSEVNRLEAWDAKDEYSVILQKDTNPITIGTYKGNTKIIYAHDKNDPTKIIGGDFIINSVNPFTVSQAVLVTDNEGLNTASDKAEDKNLVSETLNKLANKLYYKSYNEQTDKLEGTVEIAEGLTASSAALKTGKITFNPETGQGRYLYTPETPESQTVQAYEEGITGNETKDQVYVNTGVLKNGIYTFGLTPTTITAEKPIAAETDITIQGGSIKMELKNSGENKTALETGSNTVTVTAGRLDMKEGDADIKGGTLNAYTDIKGREIKVENGGKLHMAGNLDIDTLSVNGENAKALLLADKEGVPTITAKANTIIVTDKALLNISKGAKAETGLLSVNNASANFNDTVKIGTGLKAENGARVMMRNGGEIKGTVKAENEGTLVSLTGASLKENSTIEAWDKAQINLTQGSTEGNKVKAAGGTVKLRQGSYKLGDIEATNKGTAYIEGENGTTITGRLKSEGKGSTITAVLKGENSLLEGNLEGSGMINLELKDKARWKGTGTVTGKMKTTLREGSLWTNTGKSDIGWLTSENGNIDMRESGEGYVRITNYKGKTNILYGQDGTGNIKGGDITIRKAEEGSRVNLITDNSGLNTSQTAGTEEKALVTKTLDNMARKLNYIGYQKGERNLEGSVTIAEGLTASSAVLKTGEISYSERGNGRYIEKGEKKETGRTSLGSLGMTRNAIYTLEPAKSEPVTATKTAETAAKTSTVPRMRRTSEIIYGDKETQMMRGSKTAMTAAALLWRGNNNDLERRMGDIRLGKEENGIWARYLGGKNELDKQKTSYKQTYNIAQAGYDKKKGNWTIGAALDYGTGKDTYANGTGKEKLASLSLYGTMQKEDGQYLDIILKGSRIKNDYSVYNEMNHRLDGKYRTSGLSVSMEYGKRSVRENGFYIEPSLELTAGHLSGKDYEAVSDYAGGKKMHIRQDGVNSVIGRIGLGIGKETERTSLFAKIGLSHEFGGKVKSTFSAEGEPTSGTEVELKDSWVDVEVGGSFLVNRNTYLYGTYTRNFGADLSNKWRIDAGIRFSF
ncbi:autotransporter outer membrane beta-barrel domain-containing protein [Dialister invisus]|uniref:autotransporter outer membrane beta-barrel domain-containing protein n=1 Tax=Dialister invisus TaxID=218538 RepID=UPI00351FDBFA